MTDWTVGRGDPARGASRRSISDGDPCAGGGVIEGDGEGMPIWRRQEDSDDAKEVEWECDEGVSSEEENTTCWGVVWKDRVLEEDREERVPG